VNLSNNNTGRFCSRHVDGGTSTISGVIQNGGSGAGSLTKDRRRDADAERHQYLHGNHDHQCGTIQLGASNVSPDSSAMNIAGGTSTLNGNSDRVGT